MLRYAREINDLMASQPGREWRMAELVHHVARGKPQNKQQRNRYREGIRLVLLELVGCGVVRHKPARRGGTARYIWKVPNEDHQKCWH